ncbi:alpha/beta hydrolase family protein [Noviherbaspirillum sp.]|uniref:alpha/beta hydrolase family protein n=1 Tax=Noviherbaspirillum sp. TaxID=1926288 RepID=UPI002B481511|nr:alpha/beta fold hydrolase [Noviherbaspirillum sp.]HJV79873.1 alpha/beta fold hydrolase [Noviherbaspirillum sp.]
MKVERTDFPGTSGQRLAARLDSPDHEPRAFALFAHCFTCGKDIFATSRISQALTEHGIAVLRFDFTGLGASEGEFANTNFSSNLSDLIAAANHLRTMHIAPSLLIGHSLGGAAILAATSDIPESRAVATIGAPSDPGHVTGLFREHLDQINAEGEAAVQLAGRPFRIKRQFLEDAAEHKLTERIRQLRRALLVLHAPLDRTVDIVNAEHIFTAARHPKSFVSLDDADHLLSRRRDAIYAANIIAAWSERYIASDTPASDSPRTT